jgi:hypothetical protein
VVRSIAEERSLATTKAKILFGAVLPDDKAKIKAWFSFAVTDS